MQYCSHEFVSLSTDRLFRKLWFLCFKQWERGQATHASLGPSLPLSGSVHFHSADYPYRPEQLENFSLYFFMASCESTTTRNADSMEWTSLKCPEDARVQLRAACCCQDHIMTVDFPEAPLTDDTGAFFYKYRYYLRLNEDSLRLESSCTFRPTAALPRRDGHFPRESKLRFVYDAAVPTSQAP